VIRKASHGRCAMRAAEQVWPHHRAVLAPAGDEPLEILAAPSAAQPDPVMFRVVVLRRELLQCQSVNGDLGTAPGSVDS
jgi:hypothetical protein